MANKLASLICFYILLSAGLVPATAQDAASQNPPTQSSATDAAAPSPAQAETDVLAVQPVFPPLPMEAAAMSVQCTVPQAQVARSSPLTATAARIEAGRKVKVLAMGTSAFWSDGSAMGGRNYPSRVGSILEKTWKGVNIEIVNRGVSGEIASVSARRLINEAAALRPTLVLWQLGTNDAVARVPVPDFEATVRSTVRMLQDNKIDVILVGLQYTPKFARDSQYFEIRAALERVASDENLLLVRRDRAMEFLAQKRANRNIMADDDFSLFDLGFPCMAEHIAQSVIANIFLRRSGDKRSGVTAPVR
jgi:acyl-CoA thioesterase I